MLKFCSIASGSSGNCYYIESKNTALLVDIGISARSIVSTLKEIDVQPHDIEHVFLTHEHVDHIRSISAMQKKLVRAKFYASEGTWDAVEEKKISYSKRNYISSGEDLQIGDITVTAFELSHDANEPIGYIFDSDGARIAIVTDTGIITPKCKKVLKNVDILVLESNYEKGLLMVSKKYPWSLKQRIMSEYGHLSNDAAADFVEGLIADCENCRLKTLILAHLSKETNYPELAYQNMESRLSQICSTDQKIHLDVARREVRSQVYTIR